MHGVPGRLWGWPDWGDHTIHMEHCQVSQSEKVNEQCGRRNEVQVQIDNDTFQYGHEYVGLNPIFQVFSLILVWSASSFYPAVCDWWQSCAGIQDGSQVGFTVQKRKNSLPGTTWSLTRARCTPSTSCRECLARTWKQSSATIRTWRWRSRWSGATVDNRSSPQHHLVGSSMSGAWINLKNLDSINREELTRVFQIMQVKNTFTQSLRGMVGRIGKRGTSPHHMVPRLMVPHHMVPRLIL